MLPQPHDVNASPVQVSTLFEESSIFPLKAAASVDLSCSMDSTSTQEEMAQSAHLKTLGLCRISAARPPPPPPPPCDSSPPKESRMESVADGGTGDSQTSRRRQLPCPLCPLMLPSRRLLDVHVRSHQEEGGFICCGVSADSWGELEPHWRNHCRRSRTKDVREKKKKKTAEQVSQTFSCSSQKKIGTRASQDKQTHDDNENSGQETFSSSIIHQYN